MGGIIAPALHLAVHAPEAETRSECTGEAHVSADRHHGQAVICWLCEAVPVGTLAAEPEVVQSLSYDEAPDAELVSALTLSLPGAPSPRAPPVA